ncbi:FtsX-like permease family protein [Kineosporia sp. NBRC 101731]|uniref:FtsX-like permease family protein n=1 Tax=Kineosporia sp. NBRC 101731 TaxID=3032199 RepID=UPI0024A5717F|nr:FtsX-like permease family protein [Kineosporia sp. NBRC 101731]GLY27117.1 hypothetical protein Kisp02_04820 [Kineosporia sp. NBRC 101731]
MLERIVVWRAALRLARRDAWRNKGRSALVALMVALPVLALATVSVLWRSDERDPQDDVRVRLGVQAQAEITYGYEAALVQTPDGRDYTSRDDPPVDEEPGPATMAQFEKAVTPLIPARDQVVSEWSVNSNRNLQRGDRLIGATLREIDYTANGLGGLLEQVAGRAPERAGEVVVSRRLADAGEKVGDPGVKVGDRLTYRPAGNPERSLTVVGVVDGLTLESSKEVIGRPGTFITAAVRGALKPQDDTYGGAYTRSRLIVVGPDPVTWSDVLDLNERGAVVLSRQVIADPPPATQLFYNNDRDLGDTSGEFVGITVVVIGMVLLQIALLAGPAIAVGARRNQHTLALLAATGAQRRHLRTVVLATNGVIGLVSCTAAAGLGTLLGIVIIAVLRAHDVTIVRIDVHPIDLLVLVGVGVFTSLGASLIPARQAAKLDVVAALTGRRGYSPPALRVPVLGLVLVAIGTGLAVFTSKADLPFVTVLGLGLAEIGLVAASGAIVALAARLAVRLPFSARFALRDAARQRGRTAPAVAAVLAAIAGGSAALVYMAAQDDYDHRNYRPTAAAGVITVDAHGYSFDDAEVSLPRAEALLRKELPIGTLQPFRTPKWGDDGDTEVMLIPLLPPDLECPSLPIDAGVSMSAPASMVTGSEPGPCPGRSEPETIEFGRGDLFDDGTVLQVLTDGAAPAAAAALTAGRVVTTDPEVIWPDGKVHISVERWSDDDDDGDDDIQATVVALDAVPWPSGDRKLTGLVYPPAAAGKLGVELEASGFLADTTRSVTKDEEDRINDLLHIEAGVQMDVERGYVSQYALGLLALLVAAAVISLVGTFTAVGLAAAESRADLSTLAAVGAGPGVRRRLAAAQAGVISGLGGVLGVVSGILAGWVLIRMQRDWSAVTSDENLWRLVLPWWHLLAVGLGIPLLAMLIAFGTTRSRLTVVRRPGQ